MFFLILLKIFFGRGSVLGMNDVLEIVSVADLEGVLGIAWRDGVESYISWKVLRDRCPCALCAGEPDVMGRVWHAGKREVSEAGYRLQEWRKVGNYALQLVWGDGHNTGLYSYRYLRDLGREAESGGDKGEKR